MMNPTILIVEDDEGLNLLLQNSLQKAGYQTKGVRNGTEALNYASKNCASLLLVDYNLPDMTGKEVARKLIELKHPVNFIIITAHGNEEVAVEMMKLGARNYVVKNSNLIHNLPRIVKRVLNNIEMEQKVADAEHCLERQRRNQWNKG